MSRRCCTHRIIVALAGAPIRLVPARLVGWVLGPKKRRNRQVSRGLKRSALRGRRPPPPAPPPAPAGVRLRGRGALRAVRRARRGRPRRARARAATAAVAFQAAALEAGRQRTGE